MKRHGRQLITLLAVLASIGVCIWITTVTDNVSKSTKRINIGVLVLMIGIIVLAGVWGIRRAESIIRGLERASAQLSAKGASARRMAFKKLNFSQKYLDEKYQEYQHFQSEHGEAQITDFINEEDIENYTGRGVLEMVSDLLTSIGILGTFLGLVIGLQGFNPGNYEQVSASMSPLIDGIKVAFLTSIYGIALSLSYSYGLLSTYRDLEMEVGNFLEKYDFAREHTEEPYGQILEEEKQQTEILRELTESFTTQLAQRFEEVITPTIQMLGEQFSRLSENQKDMFKEAAAEFAAQFRESFLEGFTAFEENLGRVNELQVQYMKFLNISMDKLEESLRQEGNAVGQMLQDIREASSGSIQEMNTMLRDTAKITRQQIRLEEKHMGIVDAVGKNLEQSEQKLIASVQGIEEIIQKMDTAVNALGQMVWNVRNFVEEDRKAREEKQDSYMELLKDWENTSVEGMKYMAEILQKTCQEQHDGAQETQKYYQRNQKIYEEIGEQLQFMEKTNREAHETSTAALQKNMQTIQGCIQEITNGIQQMNAIFAQLQNGFEEAAAAGSTNTRPGAKADDNDESVMTQLLFEMRRLVELEQKKNERGFVNFLRRRFGR
ncbi:MAG: MotA/TolQ/ExbB proton channel family protein [Eubacteriales bacterium]|nr:MotA/TolQ/ExbB proton channel family protein [Eubacteriales bacterium]